MSENTVEEKHLQDDMVEHNAAIVREGDNHQLVDESQMKEDVIAHAQDETKSLREEFEKLKKEREIEQKQFEKERTDFEKLRAENEQLKKEIEGQSSEIALLKAENKQFGIDLKTLSDVKQQAEQELKFVKLENDRYVDEIKTLRYDLGESRNNRNEPLHQETAGRDGEEDEQMTDFDPFTDEADEAVIASGLSMAFEDAAFWENYKTWFDELDNRTLLGGCLRSKNILLIKSPLVSDCFDSATIDIDLYVENPEEWSFHNLICVKLLHPDDNTKIMDMTNIYDNVWYTDIGDTLIGSSIASSSSYIILVIKR